MPATIVGPNTGSFTTAYEDILNNWLFHGTVPARILTKYLGLSTGAANKAGTIAGEPPGAAGYARVAFGANYFAASPNEYTTVATVSVNVAPFTFPTPTGAWPTVLSVFMADAPTGGNVIWMANLSAPRTFGVGVVPGFAAGTIVISR
jgi:hypothetical protein